MSIDHTSNLEELIKLADDIGLFDKDDEIKADAEADEIKARAEAMRPGRIDEVFDIHSPAQVSALKILDTLKNKPRVYFEVLRIALLDCDQPVVGPWEGETVGQFTGQTRHLATGASVAQVWTAPVGGDMHWCWRAAMVTNNLTATSIQKTGGQQVESEQEARRMADKTLRDWGYLLVDG